MEVRKLDDTINVLEREIHNIADYSEKLKTLGEIQEKIEVANERIDLNNHSIKTMKKSIVQELDTNTKKMTAIHESLSDDMQDISSKIKDNKLQNDNIKITNDSIKISVEGLYKHIDSIQSKTVERFESRLNESEKKFKKIVILNIFLTLLCVSFTGILLLR